ncbi:MAG: dimethylamine:corrinoid methyltransferase [Bacillota bacterium]|nr:dimethylamine:corrinoid methyltransferase [Bacillota bacterium]
MGDPLGQEATHGICASMGGVRTTGDMVMRLQIAKKMRIDEAKKYVAEKLGLTVEEICDVVTMAEVREERGLGLANFEPYAESNIGMEAKFRIAEILDIKINSVERFKERAGLK